MFYSRTVRIDTFRFILFRSHLHIMNYYNMHNMSTSLYIHYTLKHSSTPNEHSKKKPTTNNKQTFSN